MFLAGGPIYHWNSTHDTEHFVSDGGDVVLQFDTSGWTTGLDLGIGFEWFFQNRLSMGARYGVAGLYGKSTIDRSETESGSIPAQDSIYQDSSHDKTFTFQTDETLVTLTAYF